MPRYSTAISESRTRNEGHGFRKLANKLAFHRRVKAVLAKNTNVPEGRVKIGTPVTVPDKPRS